MNPWSNQLREINYSDGENSCHSLISDNFARMTRWIVKLSGIAFGNRVIDSKIAFVAKFS